MVEATLSENCRRIKAVSPGTRCLLYHNLELALQSFESQRAVMYDPSFQDWFIQYTDGKGNKNGVTYNEGGAPGDQFFVSSFCQSSARTTARAQSPTLA